MPRWFRGDEQVPHLRTLAEALRRHRRLAIAYQPADSAGRSAATRKVGPLGLVNKAGTWYLVATSSGGRVSVFRAGRIASATILDEPSDRPADFDLALFWDRWSAEFTTSRPRLPVRLRASPQALAAFGEIFGDDARPVLDAAGPPDELGWQAVTLSFEHELAAAYRLAGFGGLVEVLSPPSVRTLLVAAAQGILDRYGSPALFAALEHEQSHADDR
jgi:predicted DNA-binding transcriptional regulator YafY